MGNYRVEYTITLKVENSQELAFQKERWLSGEEIAHVEQIPTYVEREFRETEQAKFLGDMKAQLGKDITDVTVEVTRISELQPTGDDDQM